MNTSGVRQQSPHPARTQSPRRWIDMQCSTCGAKPGDWCFRLPLIEARLEKLAAVDENPVQALEVLRCAVRAMFKRTHVEHPESCALYKGGDPTDATPCDCHLVAFEALRELV